MHSYYVRRGQADQIFRPQVVFVITLVAEIVQMLIILAVAQPFEKASALSAPLHCQWLSPTRWVLRFS